jgi:hypothetical protein
MVTVNDKRACSVFFSVRNLIKYIYVKKFERKNIGFMPIFGAFLFVIEKYIAF